MKSIDGTTAFITGGASGIGFAIATSLGRRGVAMAITDIDGAACEKAAASLRADGVNARAYQLDVRSLEQVRDVADRAEADLGRIAILCSNAGVVPGFMPFDEIKPELWRWVLDINLEGMFNVAHVFVPRMKGRDGHMVFTASMAAITAHAGIAAYVTSKHAVLGLADGLRNELRDSPLGVSVLCPGQIATNLTATSRAAAGDEVLEVLGAGTQPQMVGLDPAPVGELVVEGILGDRFYLFTHEGRRGEAEVRAAEQLAAFDLAPF